MYSTKAFEKTSKTKTQFNEKPQKRQGKDKRGMQEKRDAKRTY